MHYGYGEIWIRNCAFLCRLDGKGWALLKTFRQMVTFFSSLLPTAMQQRKTLLFKEEKKCTVLAHMGNVVNLLPRISSLSPGFQLSFIFPDINFAPACLFHLAKLRAKLHFLIYQQVYVQSPLKIKTSTRGPTQIRTMAWGEKGLTQCRSAFCGPWAHL